MEGGVEIRSLSSVDVLSCFILFLLLQLNASGGYPSYPKKPVQLQMGEKQARIMVVSPSVPGKAEHVVKTAHIHNNSCKLSPSFSLLLLQAEDFPDCAKQDEYQSIPWLMALSSSFLSFAHSWIWKHLFSASLLCKATDVPLSDTLLNH